MKNIQHYLFLTFAIVGIFFIDGCSGSHESSRETPSGTIRTNVQIQKAGRDLALQHFINGAALDAKGSFAEAVLEYQEALDADSNASIFYALSKDYSLLNKHLRAAEAAREAVRREPQNITYYDNLAAVYVNASQYDLAIEAFENVVKIDSNHMDAWLALARLYQPVKPLHALELYEKVLDHDGDQLDILLQCASLYTALGKLDQAEEKFKRMIAMDPSSKPLQRQLAETYAKDGKFDEAIKILRSMLDVDQSDPEVTAALADIYLNQREFQKAIDLYKSLFEKGITNPEVKLRIGVGLYGLIEHDSTASAKAQTIFEELLTTMPNDWRPHWYLGALAANAKQDSLASYHFNIVTTLASWNADAWWFLGTTLFGQGKYQEVLDVMQKAEKAVPKDFRVYLLQGLVYSRLEKTDKTIERLELAHTLNPKDINTLSTLALTYDAAHNYQRSDSLYEEALRIDPKSALLLNNYGYSLSERNLQLERALTMANAAVTAEPANAAYLDTYGWVLYKLEQYARAAEYIEKSISTGSASAVVHEHLGDVYYKMGEKEKALTAWKKALDMDPKNEELRKKIARE